MRNTPSVDRSRRSALASALGLAAAACHAAPVNAAPAGTGSLSARQQAIVPIAAFAASGDIARLSAALQRGLDAGLGVNELKELLVQVYAYAGFPRSLNALGELMKVLEARRQRGLRDREGPLPSRPVPRGDALLAAGTANQTKLSGGPVRGPLFDFAQIGRASCRERV